MKLDILVSTMNQKNCLNLRDRMNIQSNCIFVNQIDYISEEVFVINEKKIKVVNRSERGLSKSRNLAIENSDADICLLSDDDITYLDMIEEKIINEFEKDKTVDIIAFKLEGKDKLFKVYSNKEKKVSYLNSMKLASVEIAFRRKSIIDNNIIFNELLGAGSKFFMGEESEFLFKCIKLGLKIKFVPIKIGNLIVGESTWFNGFNKEYFISKGAAFTAMSKKNSTLLIFQFAIRKRSIYKENIKMSDAIKYMLKGKKEYINLVGDYT